MIDERLMDVIYGNCTFINKPTFGSFDLAEIIAEDFKDNLPEEIIICGFVTSICVLANAVILRAKFPNTKITVLKDLCAGVTEKDHDAALEVLKMQQIDIK
jgi:nicotinamidase-related amidase